MITIPKQLQQPEFRFVLLGKWNLWRDPKTKEKKEVTSEEYEKVKKEKKFNPLGKTPFEKEWQTKNNYRYDDSKFINHKNNFGVIGGYGKLRFLDIDDEELGKEFEKKLDTFTIKTGSGGKHFYFISDYETNHVLINELGELRAKSYQVVSAPCRHPSGNYYEVVKDIPIKKVSEKFITDLLKPYLREEQSDVSKNLDKLLRNELQDDLKKEEINLPKAKDTSRSGKEMSELCKLIMKKLSKEKVFSEMDVYAKWSSASEQYKELSYKKAKDYVEKMEEKGEIKTKIKLTSKEKRKIFQDIKNVLKEYMDLKEEYYTLIALWIMGTFYHKKFPTYPYLFFNAMKGSGKTRLLKIIASLSKNGKIVGSMTEAVMFRTASDRTLCIDEFENVASKETTNLRLLLNSAYKKGLTIDRLTKKKTIDGEKYEVEEFEVFCPISLANIWGMENVLSDRCISLILERSSKEKITRLVEDFESDDIIKSIKETLESSDIPDFTELYKGWNEYVKNANNENSVSEEKPKNQKNENSVSDLQGVTYTSYTTYAKILYKEIIKTDLQGRDLELFLPLFILALEVDKNILNEIIELSKNLIKERKEQDREENRDVQLIEFVSQYFHSEFVSVNKLVSEFKDNIGVSEDWLNSSWVGRALRRLDLIKDKRNMGSHREVKLNIEKAKEKMGMFKDINNEEVLE